MMYDAYLRFPRAFYDRHATGEVISRATNDIYPVRYFIGWGVVQAIQSMMMLVGAAIVLVSVNARLTLYRRARDAADRRAHVPLRAQGVPDLAHRAGEEGAPDRGHRRGGRRDRDGAGVRPRGRRPGALHRARRGGPLGDHAPGGRRGAVPPGADLPPLARDRGRALLRRQRDAIDGTLTIGQFTLFITLLLQLVWPLEALGWIINLGQRATAAASRSFAWLDSIEPLPEPARPEAPAGRTARRSGWRTSTSATASGKEVLSGVDLEVAARRDRRRLRRHRRGQDVAPEPAAALLRPDRRAAC